MSNEIAEIAREMVELIARMQYLSQRLNELARQAAKVKA